MHVLRSTGQIAQLLPIQRVVTVDDVFTAAQAQARAIVIPVIAVLLVIRWIVGMLAESGLREVQPGYPVEAVVVEVGAIAVRILDPVSLAVLCIAVRSVRLLQRGAQGTQYTRDLTGYVIDILCDSIGAIGSGGRERAGIIRQLRIRI